MNKTTRISRAKSNTYNSIFNVDIPRWSEARSRKEEDIGIRKGRRKSNVDNKKKEVKVKNSEEEEIKIPKCSRKSHVETVNEETKEIISEEEDIGIHKCRIIIRVDNMNEEVKRWTFSYKKQEYHPEITKTKEEIHLEQMKRKVKRAALEWDYFVLQEHMKSLIYVDCSLRGDSMKENFIDELNLKNCVLLRRNKSSKFFVSITLERKYIIRPECFDANNIISYTFIHNLKCKPNMVHDLSRQMKISL